MKKFIVAIFAVFALISCQEQRNIAFVDNIELIKEYQERKDLDAEYQKRFDDYRKKRDSVSKAFEIEYQQKALEAQKMSQAKQQEIAQVLNNKQQFLVNQFQAEENELSNESKITTDSLLTKIKRFVSDYAKTNGYDYILSTNNGNSVLYGTEKDDITDALLEAMNKKYEEEK